MDTIRFDRHPATVGVGDGLGMAWRYLLATWELWAAPVVAIAIVSGLLNSYATSTATNLAVTPTSSAQALEQVRSMIVPFFGVTMLLTIASVVVGWFYAAIAIHGLRGRPITGDWVLGAGLRSFAGSILMAVAWIGAWIVFALLAVITQGILLIALIGLIPAAIYVMIRLFFWTLAIFDGAGITESFRVSWDLSQGAVLRMLGWGITFVVISILVSIGVRIVTFPLGGVPAIAAFVSQIFTGTIGVFTLFGTAILYESQRWAKMPPAYGQPVAPAPTPPWATPGAPTQGGYPPSAYPPSPYPPASSYPPAPADPYAPPPAPGGYGQPGVSGPPPAPGDPGTPPALVPWGPVPPPTTWSPTPPPGWVSAPPTTAPPPAAAPSPAPSPYQPAPGDVFAPPSTPGTTESPETPAASPDESPTEPYTPPPG